MAGAEEGSRFEFLEMSNPEMLTVRGKKEPALYEACKEITRIQSQ
jgi:inhibitor of KinA sporulation pathway (predicted exonuclease)